MSDNKQLIYHIEFISIEPNNVKAILTTKEETTTYEGWFWNRKKVVTITKDITERVLLDDGKFFGETTGFFPIYTQQLLYDSLDKARALKQFENF